MERIESIENESPTDLSPVGPPKADKSSQCDRAENKAAMNESLNSNVTDMKDRNTSIHVEILDVERVESQAPVILSSPAAASPVTETASSSSGSQPSPPPGSSNHTIHHCPNKENLPPGSLCQSMMGHSLEMDKGGNLLCLLSNPGQKMTLNPAQGQLFHPLQKGMIVDTRVPLATLGAQAELTDSLGMLNAHQQIDVIPQTLPLYANKPSLKHAVTRDMIGPLGQVIHNHPAELKGTPHPRSGTAYPSRGAIYVTNNIQSSSLPQQHFTPISIPVQHTGLPTTSPLPTSSAMSMQPQITNLPPPSESMMSPPLVPSRNQHFCKTVSSSSTSNTFNQKYNEPRMSMLQSLRTPNSTNTMALNSSGSEGAQSSPDFPPTPRPPYNTPEENLSQHLTPGNLPLGPLSVLGDDSPYNEYDIGKHQHNAKERFRRSRIKKACDVMRTVVPGMTCKTDKATVLEFSAQYILYIKGMIGNEHDKEFLRRYSPY